MNDGLEGSRLVATSRDYPFIEGVEISILGGCSFFFFLIQLPSTDLM